MTTRAPACRAIAQMSLAGLTSPSTFETWLNAMSRVFDVVSCFS
jgi:hypothetical protein